MLGLFLESLGVRAWTSWQEAIEEIPNQTVPLCFVSTICVCITCVYLSI